MFKSQKEKKAEADMIRDALGTYINLDACENLKLFSVERINIVSGGERTMVTFAGANGQTQEFELLCSRQFHRDIINKLNAKQNQ